MKYQRTSSGKSKEEIARLRVAYELRRTQRKAEEKPIKFTPPKYDEEYFEAMRALDEREQL